MSRALGAGAAAALRRDGFLVLEGAVSGALARGALAALEQDGATKPPPDATGLVSYHVTAPEVLALLDALSGPVDELLGPDREPCTQAQVARRQAAAQAPQGADSPNENWHVDWIVSGRAVASHRFSLCVGVALTDASRPDHGNLVVYPGSHRKLARGLKEKGLPGAGAALARAADPKSARQVLLRPADAVLLHSHTAHGAAANLSGRPRVMAYFRVYAARAWTDRSEGYLARAAADLWLEWPGMRGAHGA